MSSPPYWGHRQGDLWATERGCRQNNLVLTSARIWIARKGYVFGTSGGNPPPLLEVREFSTKCRGPGRNTVVPWMAPGWYHRFHPLALGFGHDAVGVVASVCQQIFSWDVGDQRMSLRAIRHRTLGQDHTYRHVQVHRQVQFALWLDWSSAMRMNLDSTINHSKSGSSSSWSQQPAKASMGVASSPR